MCLMLFFFCNQFYHKITLFHAKLMQRRFGLVDYQLRRNTRANLSALEGKLLPSFFRRKIGTKEGTNIALRKTVFS